MDFTGLDVCSLHPGLAALVRYAGDAASNGGLPHRSAFEPARLQPILDYFFLIDVIEAGRDYSFSTFGPRMAVLFGANLVGCRLSEVGDALMRQSLRQTYDRVVNSHLPLYLRGRYVWTDKAIAIERLLLPLADDDGCLTSICGAAMPVGIADSELEGHVGKGPAQLVGDDALILSAA